MDILPAELLFGFIMTCVVIELTPGPNMGYLTIISITEGRKAAYFATFGIALGLLIIGIAAALGVATVISNSPFMYHALRIGGVLYLLWLAWDGWKIENTDAYKMQNTHDLNIKNFRRGLITNLLNPKAALFYIAVLPTFITISSAAALQASILTCIYVLIATAIHISIVTLAGTAHSFLTNTRKRIFVRRVLSLALVLIALWFAWTTRTIG